MYIFIAGDIFGKIKDFYKKILLIEKELNIQADWVLHTGNFGVVADPARADSHLRKKGALDFSELYYTQQGVPRRTLFVEGTHEDHEWINLMRSKGKLELIRNLHLLLNGYNTTIGNNTETIRIAGMGKAFSEKTYHSDKRISKKSHSHYIIREIEQACTGGACQLLLTHQAGHGERIGPFVSNSEGLAKICFAVRPQLIVHSGYNVSQNYFNKLGVRSLSLAFEEIRVLRYENKTFTLVY